MTIAAEWILTFKIVGGVFLGLYFLWVTLIVPLIIISGMRDASRQRYKLIQEVMDLTQTMRRRR